MLHHAMMAAHFDLQRTAEENIVQVQRKNDTKRAGLVAVWFTIVCKIQGLARALLVAAAAHDG